MQSKNASFAELFRERVFVTLQVFADESGMHDPAGEQPGSDIARVCGYVSHKESWDDFTGDWQAALDAHGVRVFHMSEFTDKKNGPRKQDWPYRGWDESKWDLFARRLMKIAVKYTVFGVGGVLNVRDYESVCPDWFKVETKPYDFCVQLLLDCLLPMLERLEPPLPVGEQVAFFFDQGKQLETEVSRAFHVVKDLRDSYHRFGSLTYADKSVCIPLQAADLLAYVMRTAQSRKLKTGDSSIPAVNWEEDLVSCQNVDMCYFDAANLKQAIGDLLHRRLALIGDASVV